MILAAHTYLLSSLNCCSSNPGSHLRSSLIICHYCLAYWSTKLIQQRLPTLYTILEGEESFYTVVIITVISRPYSTLYTKGLVYQIKRDIHPSLCKTRANSRVYYSLFISLSRLRQRWVCKFQLSLPRRTEQLRCVPKYF